MVQDVVIKNTSQRDIYRCNHVFPAGKTVMYSFDPTDRAFKEIKYCASLTVITTTEPVLKVTEESAVSQVPMAVKAEATATKVSNSAAELVVSGTLTSKETISCPYCDVTSWRC